ncbi:MAG TPA: crotonase/enoyl-CoA hydratase family protein [Solirubrobacterales bacterium]|nr:crotonase/enoyl-CoA hydratase family protein [Solirubrobacterales bacterium]
MAEDRVQIEVTDSVADVRLVRSDKHNALDWPMFLALDAATDELSDRADVRAVVLHGEGPSFCSGLDFPSFMAGDVGVDEMISDVPGEVANIAQRVAYDWQRLPMPVIAAIHGNCLGGGAQIALGADIRIAGPDLRFCVMEIRYGLIPDMGISQVLPALVPFDVAKEIVFTGRDIGADEALELGLVTRLSSDPVEDAMELATEIAAKSPHAIRSGKRMLNAAYAGRSEDALKLEADLQRALIGSPNQIAAVTAAMTKEPAEFADPDPG